MRKTLIGAAAWGALLTGLATGPAAAADISRGAVLSSTCFTCHGTDGHSPGSIPSIYGIPAEIMIRNMQAFRSGERPATVMDRHARGYTDADIEAIAEYLSGIEAGGQS